MRLYLRSFSQWRRSGRSGGTRNEPEAPASVLPADSKPEAAARVRALGRWPALAVHQELPHRPSKGARVRCLRSTGARRGAARGGPNRWPLISVAKPVAESTPSALQTVAAERITRPSRAGRSCRLRRRGARPDDWSSRSPRPTRPEPEEPQAGNSHWVNGSADGGRVSTLSPPLGEWGQPVLACQVPLLTCGSCSPNGIRTRVATLRGWCPRPLDDGAVTGAARYSVGSGGRTRTPNDRTRTCCVTDYTTPERAGPA